MTYLLMYALHKTWRYEYIGTADCGIINTREQKNNYILVMWHEFMFPCLISETKKDTMLIASRSGGGRTIGAVMEYFGMSVTYGSKNRNGKNKGGKEARETLEKAIFRGQSAVITVDGSVGPRRFCKPGPIALAKKTNVPIIPVSSLASSYWEFRTWDKLKLPKPFSRVIISYGNPINVTPDANGPDFFNYQKNVGQLINLSEKRASHHLAAKYGIQTRLPNLTEIQKSHPSHQS